jgi:sugar phosphate isomerase/epimerase
MDDITRLSINQATTMIRWNLREAIQGYARHGVRQIAIWRNKLAECGLAEAKRLLRDEGMRVTGLNRAGPLFGVGAELAATSMDDDRRAIDDAAELGAECLLVFPGSMTPGSKDLVRARSMVLERIGTLLPEARKAGVMLAIEPLHPMCAADRSPINTVAQGVQLCEALGEGVGIVIDIYHVWWDPDLRNQMERARANRILGFHVSDWLVPTQDMLQDRGMMGDGVIDIRTIRGWLEDIGYRGAIEVEIFSTRNWWRRDPEDVVRICLERFRSSV